MSSESQKVFESGEVILRQGDSGACAYIIERGTVEIFVEKPDGSRFSVGTRGAGSLIGEMAIVDDLPRTATVRAVETCVLLEISREDFLRRLGTADPVLRTVMQVILARHRDMLARTDILPPGSNAPPPEEAEKKYAVEQSPLESIRIAHEFREALENGTLSLNYQPIIDLATGDIAGFEALMRWEHPKHGFIPPGVFIPVAEETGLIVQASNWALREACNALKRIEGQAGYNNDLFMSVNFSSEDFASENFVGTVYETLSASDVQARNIHLEITERVLMGQPETARDTLRMCRQAGMGISIDDFGTGYSSLGYLHYFPIDTLKIDRSFIMKIAADDSARALVKSIVSLGRDMDMKVIAEGVETQDEADILKGFGCEMVQGFYFSKPLREKEIVQLLRTWTSPALS